MSNSKTFLFYASYYTLFCNDGLYVLSVFTKDGRVVTSHTSTQRSSITNLLRTRYRNLPCRNGQVRSAN